MSTLTNTSCSQPEAFVLKARMFQYSLYGLTGGAAAFFNALIVLSILKYAALRQIKDYILIAGLSLADCLYGLAHLIGCVYRLSLFSLGLAYCPIPRIYCLFTPQLFLWKINGLAGPLMLLLISIDRLIMVAQPLRFLGTAYAWRTVTAVYGLSILMFIAHWPYPLFTSHESVWAYCSTSQVLHRKLREINSMLSVASTGLSVVLYGVVVVLLRKHNSVMQEMDETDARCKAQRRMTITLGISSLLTLVFSSAPRIVRGFLETNFIRDRFPLLNEFKSYTSILLQLNAISNFFIYGMRQKEMGTALRALFRCERMPEDVRNWSEAPPSMRYAQSEIMREQPRRQQLVARAATGRDTSRGRPVQAVNEV